MTDKLLKPERLEVEHWRYWVEHGGTRLNAAGAALGDMIAIIDRLAPYRSKPLPNGE